MADDGDFNERPVRWALGGSLTALAVVAICCLLLLRSDFDLPTAEETREQGLAAVTFIVGGMLKSRSGAT